MNKVKPQAGQVWRDKFSNESAAVSDVITGTDGNLIVNIEIERQLIYRDSYYLSSFIELFEFIPQNDLEWLAVNVDEWLWVKNLGRLSKTIGGYTYSLICEDDSYTHQQWQNMRYKLGLDEKPRISAKEWARLLRNKQEESKHD